MREQEQRFVGDKQPFDYYLSAFLNATTAARNGFKVRQDRARNDRIKAWREDWESSLSPDEMQLYRFMREDRVDEHHHGGSARERGQEGVGFGFGEHRLPEGGTIYVGGIPAPLSGDTRPPVTVSRLTYTFTIAGSERKVTEACGAYLALLKRMVAEFEAAEPIRSSAASPTMTTTRTSGSPPWRINDRRWWRLLSRDWYRGWRLCDWWRS